MTSEGCIKVTFKPQYNAKHYKLNGTTCYQGVVSEMYIVVEILYSIYHIGQSMYYIVYCMPYGIYYIVCTIIIVYTTIWCIL